MTKLNILILVIKIYVIGVLIAAAIISPPAASFVPLILLAWYLFLWRWPLSAILILLTQYFVFASIPLLLSGTLPFWAGSLFSLPVLGIIHINLQQAALQIKFHPSERTRGLTGLSLTSLSLALAILSVSIVFANWALLMAGIILCVYLGSLFIFVYNNFPVKTILEDQIQLRLLAGKQEHVQVNLKPLTRYGSRLLIESDQSWVKVINNNLLLKDEAITLRLSLSPELSGPSPAKLRASALDRWGLIQTNFLIEPVNLLVIPRARYASWLAQQYLAGTRPGSLLLVSNIGAIKAAQGLRRGIEYYGNRLYQSGDSLKNIDWKHTCKYDELVSKEFTEPRGQPAIILVNLVAGDAEEADLLAYNIIVTAISLGRENIPAVISAYNHQDVILITEYLSAQELVLRSLQVVKEIVTLRNREKYLNPPNISRLKSNLNRLKQIEGHSAGVLSELLEVEYKNLLAESRINPVTLALSRALAKVPQQSSVVTISHRNHDAESLAFNSYRLSKKGVALINIDLLPAKGRGRT
jgi:hypothetical protein